jgi:outer membrane protein assembly factor BamB
MNTNQKITLTAAWLVLAWVVQAGAQDWPQWRGANRDGKATGFVAPEKWPETLKEQWKANVGSGDSTPSLVGDKLYAFNRQGDREVNVCLNAGTGKQVWSDKYAAEAVTGVDSGHPGPRSSPTVVGGKVFTLGVSGIVSCLDAATGKVIWRKNDVPGFPRFHTAMSPLVVDGMCIVQVGGQDNGSIVAYDVATGDQKWKWTGEAPSYASPMLMTVGGMKVIIAETERSLMAVGAADGKQLWKIAYAPSGMGYNASTPLVDGDTLIYAGQGRGVKAVQLVKEGDALTAKDLWANSATSPQFNSPVLKDGLLFGLSQSSQLFCLNVKDGQTAWTSAIAPAAGGGGGGAGPRGMQGNLDRTGRDIVFTGMGGGGGGMGRGMGGGSGGGMRGGGMGGTTGYGSIVDAGSVLLALTPSSELIVFKPSGKAFEQVARIKVASSPTYACPVVSGKRLFIKDSDSVIAYSLE